jgi:hypothetical protein
MLLLATAKTELSHRGDLLLLFFARLKLGVGAVLADLGSSINSNNTA